MKAYIKNIFKHPSYDPDTADYDVAVLELDSELRFNKYTQPICLPAATHVFPMGKKCVITGWGYLKEDNCKICFFKYIGTASHTPVIMFLQLR